MTYGSAIDRAVAMSAFYAARDQRTLQYGATVDALTRPVTLIIDSAAATTADGQAVARALIDMLARVHRQVRIVAPEVVMAGDQTLGRRLAELAAQIDPFQNTERAPHADELVVLVAGRAAPNLDECDSGTGIPGGADVVATWWGGRGEVHIGGVSPIAYSDMRHTPDSTEPRIGQAADPIVEADHLLGACTAACLAAAAVFGLALGSAPEPTAINMLERTAGADASPASIAGPIEIGDVQVVGAGAVAHALAYWAREYRVVGEWEFVDGDLAEIHNTNRCMAMTTASAGWPNGVASGEADHKVTSVAAIIDAVATPTWFDELPADRKRRDLVLVLANERNVRTEVASMGEPLLLHATTSPNWTAELHRHVADVDDCPGCRIPETARPSFGCSSGAAVPGSDGSGDAALPFLSAAAGLMLAVALLDLGHRQTLLAGRFNHWPLNMSLIGNTWQRVPHPGGRCPHTQPAAVRATVQAAEPRRWDYLDRTAGPA